MQASPPAALRLVEDPLGPDALEKLDRDELMAMWEVACRQPVPEYHAAISGPLLARGYRRG